MNTPKFFGGLCACFFGAAILWGFVTGSITYGVCAVIAIAVGMYFVLGMLNSWERNEIHQKRPKKGRRHDHR